MISYSWAQKDRMRELGFYIKSMGFPIWLDVEQMEGNILQRMSEAVEKASIVIIGVSSHYKESQSCRTEASYAYRLKKNTIFVMAEDGYSPLGWLGAMVGNNLWYSPWTDPKGFQSVASSILGQINKFHSPSTEGKEDDVDSFAPVPTSAPASAPAPALPPKRDYSNVKVLERKEALSQEMLQVGSIPSWGMEEIGRWLRDCNLDELLKPFVFHKIDGAALLDWSKLDEQGFTYIWEGMDIEERGTLLKFRRHLNQLLHPKPSPKTWNSNEVANWLKKVFFPPFFLLSQS